MTEIACSIVSEFPALARWEAEWWRLWHEDPQSTPFQSPAWLVPWVRDYGSDRLRFCMVHQGGTLMGLLPIIVQEPGSAELVLAGSDVSDYLDGLFHPGCADAVLSVAFKKLADSCGDTASITLTDLRPSSPLSQIWPMEWMETAHSEYSVCPCLPLSPEMTLKDQIPKRIRKELEYRRRRIARDFKIRKLTIASNGAEALFDCLVALQAKRWAERDREWLLCAPAARDFHRSAFVRLAEHGLADIQILLLDNVPAGGIYTLLAHRRCYYYVGGFDPEFARYSIGTLMIGSAIETALAAKCRLFDFLRGSEPYKYRWGARDTNTYWRIVSRRGARDR